MHVRPNWLAWRVIDLPTNLTSLRHTCGRAQWRLSHEPDESATHLREGAVATYPRTWRVCDTPAGGRSSDLPTNLTSLRHTCGRAQWRLTHDSDESATHLREGAVATYPRTWRVCDTPAGGRSSDLPTNLTSLRHTCGRAQWRLTHEPDESATHLREGAVATYPRTWRVCDTPAGGRSGDLPTNLTSLRHTCGRAQWRLTHEPDESATHLREGAVATYPRIWRVCDTPAGGRSGDLPTNLTSLRHTCGRAQWRLTHEPDESATHLREGAVATYPRTWRVCDTPAGGRSGDLPTNLTSLRHTCGRAQWRLTHEPDESATHLREGAVATYPRTWRVCDTPAGGRSGDLPTNLTSLRHTCGRAQWRLTHEPDESATHLREGAVATYPRTWRVCDTPAGGRSGDLPTNLTSLRHTCGRAQWRLTHESDESATHLREGAVATDQVDDLLRLGGEREHADFTYQYLKPKSKPASKVS